MQPYLTPDYTAEERLRLESHFTSVDGPVSALVGLPEATKAALFARYSRTAKPLMRVFLDEFVDATDAAAPAAGGVGSARASDLFSRVISEYGDDSVAQLAGIHVSCEQVSNLLTKVLERGRLMGYLEQSTRYVYYGDRPADRHRYYRDPGLFDGPLGAACGSALDGLFDAYSLVYQRVKAMLEAPIAADDAAARRAARAAALDVARGLLPAATVSNVGMFGSPQAYEQLILRMRSDPLPEARDYAELLVAELRKVIPDFLARLDRPDRGGVWVEYRRDRAEGLRDAARGLDGAAPSDPPGSGVRLVRWTADAEDQVIAHALYPFSRRPLGQILDQVAGLPEASKDELFDRSVGVRRNRRHRPGREWEAAQYEFDIVSDYGAFRDLQRHRLLTIDWQRLGVDLGYAIPEEAVEAGVAEDWRVAVERAEIAYRDVAETDPARAAYFVTMAHRVRYQMTLNAREAMHLVELRSSPQGHPNYRRVAQEMHAAIRDVAGHRRIAAAMAFVNQDDVHLGRLDAERRAGLRSDVSA